MSINNPTKIAISIRNDWHLPFRIASIVLRLFQMPATVYDGENCVETNLYRVVSYIPFADKIVPTYFTSTYINASELKCKAFCTILNKYLLEDANLTVF